MPFLPKLGSRLPSASKRITVAELITGSGVELVGSGRVSPTTTTRPSESTATPERTKTPPVGRGTVTTARLPKLGSSLPSSRKRTILEAPATTTLPPGATAIFWWPGVNSKGSSYCGPLDPALSDGKPTVILPSLPKLLSRSPAIPAGFATALAAIAARQAQIMAAARAVFQTLSIVHFLLSGDDRPVVVVCPLNAGCSAKF